MFRNRFLKPISVVVTECFPFPLIVVLCENLDGVHAEGASGVGGFVVTTGDGKMRTEQWHRAAPGKCR